VARTSRLRRSIGRDGLVGPGLDHVGRRIERSSGPVLETCTRDAQETPEAHDWEALTTISGFEASCELIRGRTTDAHHCSGFLDGEELWQSVHTLISHPRRC
jgi:hypothetical protein